MLAYRFRSWSLVLLCVAGCPAETVEPARQGLVSIQDLSIANLPQAGHGLSVQAFFTPLAAPDFEEQPGAPFGCKVVVHVHPPRETDQGRLHIAGIAGGPIACRFAAGRGYVCPTESGRAAASVSAPNSYALEGVTLTAADVGRYLQISGAERAENNGAFPILGVAEDGALRVANPRAVAERFDASYSILAGAGPTPSDLYSPFLEGEKVRVRLEGRDFDPFEVAITPGAAMRPDAETAELLSHVDPNARELRLSCEGPEGECGTAAVTIVRITTTDGDVSGLPATAMPPAERSAVEIQCAQQDTGTIRVPSQAMQFLKRAHITRIRTAFMRDGFAFAESGTDRTTIVAGRGVIGFTTLAE